MEEVRKAGHVCNDTHPDKGVGLNEELETASNYQRLDQLM